MTLNPQNVIKGPLTSLVGLLIIVGSAYSAFMGHVSWVWEGLTGVGVGTFLIFTPDSIKQIVEAVIKKKTQ
jgi:hypothetical protein